MTKDLRKAVNRRASVTGPTDGGPRRSIHGDEEAALGEGGGKEEDFEMFISAINPLQKFAGLLS